jgi:glyoxylase-like metal-dependent hydrolase (beta-lactamase superfamily II)
MSIATQNEGTAAAQAAAASIDGGNRVRPISFGHSNIYLIQTESGYILVDAGMPNSEEKLDSAFQEAGVEPGSVQLIVATHGHLDHVGTLAHARKVTGGKVLCHRSFAGDLANGNAEKAVPQNLVGRLLNIMTGLMGSKFEGIQPDILVDDEFDLAEYGVAGKIIHTPGHSPSSISIILDNGEALVGDMVRGAPPDEISLGMFYEDKGALLASLENVAAHEPRIIYMSHGTQIDNDTLRSTVEAQAGAA